MTRHQYEMELHQNFMSIEQQHERKQWRQLESLLETPDGRCRLLEQVIMSMLKMHSVNVKQLAQDVTDKLGPQYGAWAKEVVEEAAQTAGTPIVEGEA